MFGKNRKSGSGAAAPADSRLSSALPALRQMVAGDFDVRLLDISGDDAVAEALHLINDLADRCDAYVRESAACMGYVSENKYYRKIIETSMQGDFLAASKKVNSALSAIKDKVSSFRLIADQFEQTVAGVVDTVASASTELTASSEIMQDIARGTSERATSVAAAAEEASVNVQTVSSASEELSASISEISGQVSNASSVVNQATRLTSDIVSRTQMLQEATNRITSALDIINDIAGQTNLLALNATIEAARAGEAGKGFAVVANEVKNLANQTAKATDEVAGFIDSIRNATDTTVNGVKEIAAQVESINEVNAAVSAAVEEQSAATREIAKNIQQASEGTQDVTANITNVTRAAQETGSTANEVNAAARELSQQSEKLRSVVGEFLAEVRRVA